MKDLYEIIRAAAVVVSFCISLYTLYKVILEIQQPRKALEEKVTRLDKWHREDHDRIKKTEKMNVLIVESLSLLLEHEITGNGKEQYVNINDKINRFLREGYYD